MGNQLGPVGPGGRALNRSVVGAMRVGDVAGCHRNPGGRRRQRGEGLDDWGDRGPGHPSYFPFGSPAILA